ncbi:hypothetical protein [Flavobacterium caeni]|uniref:Uncharacterized protein n=1 Tax=Flavobacterium caeni TaxID=490189 RepID=A0A1G5KFB8_9FLAO|nr:hypothetical protein [Flavobacterium caeni]SCY98740.1 hypothetical protein SAMN02927903_03250 [Flavobacterium caeni]
MAVNVDIPYSTNEGIDYLIRFTVFPEEKLPEGIHIPVVDIVIETNAEVNDIKNTAFSLIKITQIISNYALEHDAIYYCYCSSNPIKRSEKKADLTHQEYRSILFCKLFEKNNNPDFVNRTVIINDPEQGNHYIHLISRLKNNDMINLISETLNTFDK